MGDIYGIHHICVNTPDIDRSIAFYCDIIGFRLLGKESCAFGEYAMLRLNDSRLELIQPKNPDANSFGNCGSLTHFGLAVHDIDAVVAELRAKGVEFLTDAIDDFDEPMGGLRAISLLGPSGEAINLYEFKRDF